MKHKLSPRARRDWAYAAHACLCASMLVWRTVEATPGLSSARNGTFPSSPLGIASTMILLWLGVASLLAVIAFTWMTLDDLRLWILFALMWLSLLWRRDIDVFDVTYVASVAVLAVWWFRAGRCAPRTESRDDASAR